MYDYDEARSATYKDSEPFNDKAGFVLILRGGKAVAQIKKRPVQA